VPAWNWIFGLSYDLDPTPPAVAAAAAPTVAAGPVSHVLGRIVDSDTGQPIAGARIAYPGRDFTDQITSADGRFRSFDFAPGEDVTISISHPAYDGREVAFAIGEAVREGQIPLTAAFTGTRVTGTVLLNGDSAPVSILVQGAEVFEVEVPAGDATYVLDIPPGEYSVLISAPGHNTEFFTRTFELGRVTYDIALGELAAGTDLRRTPTGIEVVPGSEGVSFGADETLTAAGQGVLDELVALMQADASLRVRIRAHVDDRGDSQLEGQLCQSRADAVIGYLTSQGVDSNRLQAEPVGAIEPLFPNISERNRRLNNRIEFLTIR
jgi:outer membrane protein OmpA-like peptidoglycan-associated protein